MMQKIIIIVVAFICLSTKCYSNYYDFIIFLENEEPLIQKMDLSNNLNSPLSRAESAIILDKTLLKTNDHFKIDVNSYPNPFADVDRSSDYYESLIKLAYYEGDEAHVNDDSNQTVFSKNNELFNPLRHISREEFIKIVIQGFDIPLHTDQALDEFYDNADMSSWATKYISTAVHFGIIVGNNGYLLAKQKITILEALKVLTRTVDKFNNNFHHLDNKFQLVESINTNTFLHKIIGVEYEPDYFIKEARPIEIIDVQKTVDENNNRILFEVNSNIDIEIEGAFDYYLWRTNNGFFGYADDENYKKVYFYPTTQKPIIDYQISLTGGDNIGFSDNYSFSVDKNSFKYENHGDIDTITLSPAINIESYSEVMYPNEIFVINLAKTALKKSHIELGYENIFVEMLAHYFISEESIQKMRDVNLPIDICNKLMELQNKEYIDEKMYDNILSNLLGEEYNVQYENLIKFFTATKGFYKNIALYSWHPVFNKIIFNPPDIPKLYGKNVTIKISAVFNKESIEKFIYSIMYRPRFVITGKVYLPGIESQAPTTVLINGHEQSLNNNNEFQYVFDSLDELYDVNIRTNMNSDENYYIDQYIDLTFSNPAKHIEFISFFKTYNDYDHISQHQYFPNLFISPSNGDSISKGVQTSINWEEITGTSVSLFFLPECSGNIAYTPDTIHETISQLNWKQFADEIDNTGQYSFDPEVLQYGGYTYFLIVTNTGEWDITNGLISIFNNSPIADAGGPYIILEDEVKNGVWPVTLTAQNSSIPEGVQKYIWDFGDGNTQTIINNISEIDYEYTFSDACSITLTVIDSLNQKDTDTTSVIMFSSDAPIADAGGPYTASEIDIQDGKWVVRFDGKNSTDDYGIKSYKWDIEGFFYEVFNGMEIENTKWTYFNVEQDEMIKLHGTGQWGSSYIFSRNDFKCISGNIFQCRIRADEEISNLIWGLHNNSSLYDISQMVYSIYLSDGKWSICEDGVTRGQFGEYNCNTWYDLKIEFSYDNIVIYYYKASEDSDWILLYKSDYISQNDNLIIGAMALTGKSDVDDIALHIQKYGKTITHQYDSSGVYEVNLTVTDYAEQKSYDTTSLIIAHDNLPVAYFDFYERIEAPNILNFNAERSLDNLKIVKYEWDFGDDSNGYGIKTYHFYEQAGIYIVTLTVYDEDFQSNSFTKTINIDKNNSAVELIQILRIIADMPINMNTSDLDINNDLKIDIIDALTIMNNMLYSDKTGSNYCYSSCKQIKNQGYSRGDGIYSICPNRINENVIIDVYCDMTTEGGGWTFLQGSIAENSYDSIINACPENTKPFQLKSTNHAKALESYIKNIAQDDWYFANVFSGPNVSNTCEDEHTDIEVGYLSEEKIWKNSNIDEISFGIDSSNNCNLNIYDPVPINHSSGLTNRSGNNFFYNITEQIEEGIVICSTNDIDAYTELSNAFTITTYPASDFTNDTLAMNNKFGINNYIIEDFEDVNLVEELSIQIGDNPSLTQLSQVYDPSTWGPSAWDGQYVILNSTDNDFDLAQTTFKSRITFLIKGGTTSFGIGLSNFQRGATQKHPIIINGQQYFENIGSLSNYTDYIDQNSAKNMYLRIDAKNGESIESITFGYDGSNVDGLMFDHLAFKKNDLEQTNLNDGLVAYYPFNGNANDESGNGNDGEIHGAELTEDRFGNANNAFVFDGEDDYLDIKTNNDILKFKDQSISISTWIKILSNDNFYRYILYMGNGDRNVGNQSDSGGSPYISLTKARSGILDGRIYSQIYDREIGQGTVLSDLKGSELPKNEWLHVVCIIDKDIGIHMYINDQLQKEKGDYVKYDLSSIDNFIVRIGAAYNQYYYYLNGYDLQLHKGSIDDLRIYNRILSTSEINALYLLDNIEIIDDFPNNCSEAYSIEFNKEINAKIDYPGQNENDGDCDYFKFDIPEQMDVSIFTSGDTNTYGILFNCCNGSPPNCSIRIDDSNNGDNNNFRINEKLEKGTYYLKVRHEDNSNGTGNYNLHLQRNDVINLDDGLIAYYPFNGNTNDESGNGNHGIPQNGVMLTTDRFENFNSAYKFDESNDAIEISNPIGIPSMNEATLSFWASHTSKYSNENYSTMYSESNLGEDTNSYFCVQYSNSTEKLDLHSSFFDDERIFIETSFIIPFDTSWHHYLITKTGNIYNIFVDGNKVGSGEQEFPRGSEVTYIGERTPPTNYQPIIGKMDDIRIYNRTLSVSEIKLLYSMNQQNIQDDYPNTCDNAHPIELNQTINASIDYPGLNESDGDCDYFKIEISDEMAVSIYTTGDTDTYGILFNCCNGSPPNCSIRIDDSNNGDNNNFRINETLEKGTYYLKVRHEDKINGTGNYNLLYVSNNILQEHEIYTYNAEKIPSEDSWVIVNYNDYESKGATIENGLLHIKDSDQYFGSAIHYLKEWDVETNCNNIAEFNVKIVSNSGNSGIIIGTSNGSHNMTYDLLTNRVISYYKNANGIRTTGKIIDINTTDFNTYKLSIIKGVAKLFINNNLVIEQTAGTGNYNGNGVEFGAGCSSATGEAYFKEIRLYKQCNE